MSDLMDLVKELRDRTGAGLMDCRKALLANEEDLEKALVWLREKGIAKQEKKAARTAAEGVAWLKAEGNKAVLIEINCETDFVANSDPFRALVSKVTDLVFNNEPATKEEALALIDPETNKSLNDLFVDAGIKLGEKLDFRRFAVVHKEDDEFFGPYIHMKGKVAVVVVVKGGDADLANGLALNVCNDNPTYLSEADIPAEVLERERAIEKEAALNDPSFSKKPANIQEKIIEGRVQKNLSSNVLTDQVYILDQDKKVGDVLKSGHASIVSFVRYGVGEGIEKRKDDFAAEVASQLK